MARMPAALLGGCVGEERVDVGLEAAQRARELGQVDAMVFGLAAGWGHSCDIVLSVFAGFSASSPACFWVGRRLNPMLRLS